MADVTLKVGARLAVYSVREGRGGSIWVRAGSAFVNADGSLNVLLDVLPLDGKLHVRAGNPPADREHQNRELARESTARDTPRTGLSLGAFWDDVKASGGGE